jgi:hypothetical protein
VPGGGQAGKISDTAVEAELEDMAALYMRQLANKKQNKRRRRKNKLKNSLRVSTGGPGGGASPLASLPVIEIDTGTDTEAAFAKGNDGYYSKVRVRVCVCVCA